MFFFFFGDQINQWFFIPKRFSDDMNIDNILFYNYNYYF